MILLMAPTVIGPGPRGKREGISPEAEAVVKRLAQAILGSAKHGPEEIRGDGLVVEALRKDNAGAVLKSIAMTPPRSFMKAYAWLGENVGVHTEKGTPQPPFVTQLLESVRTHRQTMPEEVDPRTGMNIYDAYALSELRKGIRYFPDQFPCRLC